MHASSGTGFPIHTPRDPCLTSHLPHRRHTPATLRLDHEDAARFAFLLATPVILAAALLKLPELAGPEGNGILGQVLVGSLVAGVAAYLSLRFLTRCFHTHTLTPFAIFLHTGRTVQPRMAHRHLSPRLIVR